jgi:AraC-like DNA-binding protein
MPLSARHVVLDTTSVAAARAEAAMFDSTLSFAALGAPDAFRLTIAAADLDGIRLSAVRSTGHSIDLIEAQALTLLAPRRGRVASEAGGLSLAAEAGGIIVPAPGRRRTLVSAGFEGLVAQIPLARLAGRTAPDRDTPWRAPQGFALQGDAARALRRYLLLVAGELADARSLLGTQRGARAAAGMLADLVLAAMPPAPTLPLGDAGARQVRRAEAIMRARLAEQVTVAELAAELGCSPRALQLAFRRHREASPRDVLAAMRLDAARLRLAAGRPEDSVTVVALDCGITHLGRFAAGYRARFGEAPHETLAAARRRG